MKREKVESSNIKSIGYDAMKETLEVEFTTKQVYQYFKVPQKAFDNIMAAKSKGFYFAKYIRYTFKFEKV